MSDQRAMAPGDRFAQQMPYGRDTLTVTAILDHDRVAVERANGARQSFPISTLLEPRWWVKIEARPTQSAFA